MSEDLMEGAAAVVAGWPQVWARLIDEHVAGPDGRCTGCFKGTRAAPHWPCGLAFLGRRARELHDEQLEKAARSALKAHLPSVDLVQRRRRLDRR